jgi:hypothetical protein
MNNCLAEAWTKQKLSWIDLPLTKALWLVDTREHSLGVNQLSKTAFHCIGFIGLFE